MISPARLKCLLFAITLSGIINMPAHSETALEIPTVEDLIAPIRKAVREPDQPFDIFIEITLIPGKESAFEAAFASRMARTREEPGNLLFALSVHPDIPNVYMLHERWENLAAVEAHMGLSHMRSFWPVYLPMIARVPEFAIYASRDLAATAP